MKKSRFFLLGALSGFPLIAFNVATIGQRGGAWLFWTVFTLFWLAVYLYAPSAFKPAFAGMLSSLLLIGFSLAVIAIRAGLWD